MILTLLRIFWLHLRRDRVVWLLTFAVPVAFFSIFALIFASQGKGSTPKIRVAVVDEDGSEFAKKMVETLEKEKSLRVQTKVEAKEGEDPPLLTRKDADKLVRDGKVAAAIVLPKGLGKSFPSFGRDRPTIELLADTSDPIAPQMLSGMLQGLVMTAAPEAMMAGGVEQMKKWGGPLTPEQKKAFEQALNIMKQPAVEGSASKSSAGLLDVKVVDVLGETKASPVVAFYMPQRRR